MSGLTRLFPSSHWLGRYYLGHLSPSGTHPVDVLSGAFMWVRKEVLDKTGGFDERFFMYAEDIDLSYRIQLAGYQNYYLSSPAIIHFKGESTRRDARYVKLFYTAMIQFVQKHYKGALAWWYIKLLQGIIKLRSFGTEKNSPAAALPHHENASLIGDALSIENMRPLLKRSNIPVVINQEQAGAIIFAKGRPILLLLLSTIFHL
ncbi:glycosyltransferase family 2 protein [Paraflavitalea speifideaquila]|uniref:glycosyltransferase family 2 protein n=1 Tax=Paraflavitalea speifideaquila TaxID=3076558 RepID=UPI0028F0E219|nr:glycosyltransferase family 2 protein [Paraflavitalea speifideiaquila]